MRVSGSARAALRVSPSLLGPVDPSIRALSGRLKCTVRRHKLNNDSLPHAALHLVQPADTLFFLWGLVEPGVYRGTSPISNSCSTRSSASGSASRRSLAGSPCKVKSDTLIKIISPRSTTAFRRARNLLSTRSSASGSASRRSCSWPPTGSTRRRRRTSTAAWIWCRPQPPWIQPRGRWMVSLVNSHTNNTRIGWHLWEIDLRFAPGLPPGWRESSLLTPYWSESTSSFR